MLRHNGSHFSMGRKKKEKEEPVRENFCDCGECGATAGPQMPFPMPPEGVETEENKIYFYAEVNEKSILALNRELARLDTDMQVVKLKLGVLPVIELHINSPGGSLISGLAATDYISKCKTPVHTYVDGSAMSAATLMSIAGTRRLIHKNSFMLVHQLSSVLYGKFSECEDEMENQKLLMRTIKKIYLEKTKLNETELEALLKRDIYLDAETCLKHGLVDEIV